MSIRKKRMSNAETAAIASVVGSSMITFVATAALQEYKDWVRSHMLAPGKMGPEATNVYQALLRDDEALIDAARIAVDAAEMSAQIVLEMGK